MPKKLEGEGNQWSEFRISESTLNTFMLISLIDRKYFERQEKKNYYGFCPGY